MAEPHVENAVAQWDSYNFTCRDQLITCLGHSQINTVSEARMGAIDGCFRGHDGAMWDVRSANRFSVRLNRRIRKCALVKKWRNGGATVCVIVLRCGRKPGRSLFQEPEFRPFQTDQMIEKCRPRRRRRNPNRPDYSHTMSENAARCPNGHSGKAA